MLVRLRQRFEGEFRRFRQKWWAIAESARESASLSETTCHPGLADRVRAAAEQELRDDRNWSRKSKVISVSSLVFSVASLVPHPTLAALSFLASAVSYLADTAPVRERLVDSRFRVVCSRLARHAHAKK